MVELLKQQQYEPMPVEEQLVSIYAGTQGLLDDLEVESVREFETDLLKHFRDEHPEVLEEIRDEKALSEQLTEKLTKVIRDFQSHWKSEHEDAA